MPWGKEQRPKHGRVRAFHCKQVSCSGVEMGSIRRTDLVSISPLFIALVSHHGLYTLMLVLSGSLSALPHFLLTWAMNLCVLPCRDQAVHVSFSCAFTKYTPQSLAAHEMRVCKQSFSKTSFRALGEGGEDRLVYQQRTRERSPGAFDSQAPED